MVQSLRFGIEQYYFEFWVKKLQMSKQRRVGIRDELQKIELQIEKLLDRIVDGETQAVIAAYEKKLKILDD